MTAENPLALDEDETCEVLMDSGECSVCDTANGVDPVTVKGILDSAAGALDGACVNNVVVVKTASPTVVPREP